MREVMQLQTGQVHTDRNILMTPQVVQALEYYLGITYIPDSEVVDRLLGVPTQLLHQAVAVSCWGAGGVPSAYYQMALSCWGTRRELLLTPRGSPARLSDPADICQVLARIKSSANSRRCWCSSAGPGWLLPVLANPAVRAL